MHQTPVWETSASGPFDRWPVGDGFERFYGFMGGETNQWQPTLFEGITPVEPPDDPSYHFSEDMTTRAITYMREQKVMTPDKPFFSYVSYGACHAPFHVPTSYMEKNRGRFDQGWDKQREETFARQKQLGVIPQNCQLTERPEEIPAWDSLSADEKRVAARLMEAYAGFADHTDVQVGRIVQALTDMGALDNTVFFYILGDNGASAEGGPHGALNEMAALNGAVQSAAEILPHLDAIGGPMTYCHYPVGWAHAMNTPYQWTKQVASHWGGTRNGMVVHWPAGIKAKGRDPQPVLPRDRPRADDPRGCEGAGAHLRGRHTAATHRGRQHRLFLRGCTCGRTPHDAVFRDVRQPRHLSRRLDGLHEAQHALDDAGRPAEVRC